MRIAVENLTRRFGPVAAVTEVSLSIQEGEIFTASVLRGAAKPRG